MILFGVQRSSSVFFHFACPHGSEQRHFLSPFSLFSTLDPSSSTCNFLPPNTKGIYLLANHPSLVVSEEYKAVRSKSLVLGQLTVLKVYLRCTPAQTTLLVRLMKAVPQSFRGSRISVSNGCRPLTLPLSWRKVISSRILPSAGSHTPPVSFLPQQPRPMALTLPAIVLFRKCIWTDRCLLIPMAQTKKKVNFQEFISHNKTLCDQFSGVC